MVSFSAHKFYGPKGVGVLYLKKGTSPKSLIIGGGQETNLRAGTENTSCIAGLGLASELANKNIAKRKTHLEQLADQFKLEMTDAYPEIIYNGHPEHSLPGVISATFPSVTSNILIIKLDLQGIAVSSGSACSSGSVNTSHVLRAMNMSNDHNIRTLRISFGRDNSKEDVQLLTEKISEILKQHHNKR
jgi:cysteine desulfurase